MPKIGTKAHWISVEGVYAQSLISNTLYRVFRVSHFRASLEIHEKLSPNRTRNRCAFDVGSGMIFPSIFEKSGTHFGQLLGPKIGLSQSKNYKNKATLINTFWLLRPSSFGGAFSAPTWCHLGPT